MNYFIEENALSGKIILVTGAGDGIGRQAALSFAKYGATLILLGRTVEKLTAVYDEILEQGGTTPVIMPLDLYGATKQHYQDMNDRILSLFGHLDGILHNASLLGMLGPVENIAEQEFDTLMQVNVKSAFLMTQALLPALRNAKAGRIIFTSSTVGHIGRAFWGSYAISKFATEGLMQVLADELSNTTIRVNAINPGATRTKMRAQAFPAEDSTSLKTAQDIMPLYLYLMSAQSQHINGQCIDAQPK